MNYSLKHFSTLMTAVEQSFNAIVVTDAGITNGTHTILYANPSFCQMTGYSQTELDGKSPRILQGPETDTRVIDDLRSCLKDGRYFEGCAINYRKDGSKYVVNWNTSPVKDEQGIITHFVSVQQDVSQQVESEWRTQLLTSALNTAADAILIVTTSGIIIFANQGFENMSGYSFDEVKGKPLADIMADDYNRTQFQCFWDNLITEKASRITIQQRRKDGSCYFSYQSFCSFKDKLGDVTHYVSVAVDLTDQIERERRILDEATRDALTGVMNRRGGEVRLQAALVLAQETEQSFCLIMADIDHFKQINDQFGHPRGDAVLASCAHSIKSMLRNSDSLVRWGGEEFLIIVPSCLLAAAVELADRIRMDIPTACNVTLSFGVAQYKPDESVESLISRADQLLYKAKKNGRNRVESDAVS